MIRWVDIGRASPEVHCRNQVDKLHYEISIVVADAEVFWLGAGPVPDNLDDTGPCMLCGHNLGQWDSEGALAVEEDVLGGNGESTGAPLGQHVTFYRGAL